MNKNRRFYAYFAGFLTLTLISFILFGAMGGFNNILADIRYSYREDQVSIVQKEMDSLIKSITDHNADVLLEIRSNPIQRGSGQVYGHCIEGVVELVYQSMASLSETATIYANLFETKVDERLINGESWYVIIINNKTELLLVPVTSHLFKNSLHPYPEVCQTSDSCYNLGVYYSDPSRIACT